MLRNWSRLGSSRSFDRMKGGFFNELEEMFFSFAEGRVDRLSFC